MIYHNFLLTILLLLVFTGCKSTEHHTVKPTEPLFIKYSVKPNNEKPVIIHPED